MFVEITTKIPVKDPPPVGAILWVRPCEQGGYETHFRETTYAFWSREVRRPSELELQQAVAGITHTMHATHVSMLEVVDDFLDTSGPTWELYSTAIQAAGTVAKALCASMILHDDPDEDPAFDSIFILIPKGQQHESA